MYFFCVAGLEVDLKKLYFFLCGWLGGRFKKIVFFWLLYKCKICYHFSCSFKRTTGQSLQNVSRVKKFQMAMFQYSFKASTLIKMDTLSMVSSKVRRDIDHKWPLVKSIEIFSYVWSSSSSSFSNLLTTFRHRYHYFSVIFPSKRVLLRVY